MKLLKYFCTAIIALMSSACLHAQQPTSVHNVVLTWGASPDSGVTQYQVSRSSVTGGPYSLSQGCIVQAPLLTCSDSNVQASNTYFYVVQAFSPSGGWSVVSNEAEAVIPKNTSPVTVPSGKSQQLSASPN